MLKEICHFKYLLVYPHCYTHKHVLRPLHDCAIYAQQIRPLQSLRAIIQDLSRILTLL